MRTFGLRVLNDILGFLAVVGIAACLIVGVATAGAVIGIFLIAAVVVVLIMSLSSLVWVPAVMLVLYVSGVADDWGCSQKTAPTDKKSTKLDKIRKAHDKAASKGQYDANTSKTPVS